MIVITAHKEGLILSVRAQPGARREGIVGQQGGALKVAVTAAPEQGKANKAVLKVLRSALDLRRSQIDLFSGETSREKKVLIRELPLEALQARIQAALPD